MGLGSSGFGLFPFGSAPTTTTATAPATLTSSRKITSEGAFEIGDDGGFAGMNDIDQCVRNIVLLAVTKAARFARFATDADATKIRQQITRDLSAFTRPDDPKIKIKSLTVAANDPTGRMLASLEYRNLTTNTTQTAKAAL